MAVSNAFVTDVEVYEKLQKLNPKAKALQLLPATITLDLVDQSLFKY